jgi:hypothetical protein
MLTESINFKLICLAAWRRNGLCAQINIELSETETMTLLLIPGVFVSGDREEEFALIEKNNKIYKELQDKKISSDAFIDRGSQTMNLT